MAKSKPHSPEQIAAFLEELKSQTDRGTAVIGAAVLDDLLIQVLTERFVKLGSERYEGLFDRTGAPISTFSARIELCFAVGTINNSSRLMLHLIRDIRNAFAHRIEQMTFDHPDVAEMIDKRILHGFKKPGKSRRDMFIDTFVALSFTIYGTLSATDIRIKHLEETHQAHFQKLLDDYNQTLKEVIQAAQGEDSSNPSPTQEPPHG